MKKFRIFIFAVCVFICLFYAKERKVSHNTDQGTTAKSTELTGLNKDTIKKMTIEIDPGHGGADTGAQMTTHDTVIHEKNLNLQLSLHLKTELEKYQGVTVCMTRETDKSISLKKRVRKAKKDRANVLISIHHNAKGSIVDAKDGAYVLVASGNDKKSLAKREEQLGANILNRISELGLKNRGLLRRLSETGTAYRNGTLSDYYAIVKGGIHEDILAVIIEHGYMDNRDEFNSYFSSGEKIKKVAEKDAQGIADYFYLIKNPQKAARTTIRKKMKITTVRDPKGKNNVYQTKSFQLSVNQ